MVYLLSTEAQNTVCSLRYSGLFVYKETNCIAKTFQVPPLPKILSRTKNPSFFTITIHTLIKSPRLTFNNFNDLIRPEYLAPGGKKRKEEISQSILPGGRRGYSLVGEEDVPLPPRLTKVSFIPNDTNLGTVCTRYFKSLLSFDLGFK
jgi:hypothetical protein